MKKIIVLLLLQFMLTLHFGDELDNKMRELRRLEDEIRTTQNQARQAETRQRQTQQELSRTANLKQRTEANVKTLRQNESVVRDSLTSVNRRIENVRSNIGYLESLLNNEFEHMIRLTHSSEVMPRARQQRIMSAMINRTSNELLIQDGIRVILTHSYENHRRQYLSVNRELRREDQKYRTYERQIRNLQTENTRLTQEQQRLQMRIRKLQQDAAELESLIARLTVARGKEPTTYQFTQINILWPVHGRIIRRFGEEYRGYNTSVISNGIDIAVPENTPVVAVDDGEVVFSDRFGGQGKLIIIDHKNGFFSVYAYNNDLLANRGDKVKRGQVIARSGMTGSANQPSLHFELRRDGRAINPIPFFQ